MSEERVDLGHKRTCPFCSVKYYDFYQDVLDCPECGKNIEAVNITKPKRGRKAGVTVASSTKAVSENDDLKDLIDETDDSGLPEDDEDNLDEDISIDIPTDKSND